MFLLFFLADSDRILQGFGIPKKKLLHGTLKGPIPPEFKTKAEQNFMNDLMKKYV